MEGFGLLAGFALVIAALFSPLAIEAYRGADVKIAKQQTQAACYAAQAEAMKQHVEFKKDCSL